MLFEIVESILHILCLYVKFSVNILNDWPFSYCLTSHSMSLFLQSNQHLNTRMSFMLGKSSKLSWAFFTIPALDNKKCSFLHHTRSGLIIDYRMRLFAIVGVMRQKPCLHDITKGTRSLYSCQYCRLILQYDRVFGLDTVIWCCLFLPLCFRDQPFYERWFLIMIDKHLMIDFHLKNKHFDGYKKYEGKNLCQIHDKNTSPILAIFRLRQFGHKIVQPKSCFGNPENTFGFKTPLDILWLSRDDQEEHLHDEPDGEFQQASQTVHQTKGTVPERGIDDEVHRDSSREVQL